MSDRLVAVTGSTGFLGRVLVSRLKSHGWRVRVLVRAAAGVSRLETQGSDIVTGDLNDKMALARLVVGADAVIHIAGLIKARTRADFFTINEGGARNLALSAIGKRIIHVSSLAAREPTLSDYAASKQAGEAAMRGIAGNLVTIVRPPAIYGPGDKETLTLFKAARGPIVVVPGQSRARVAIVEVGDVARDIIELLERGPTAATVTIGGDRPQGYRWRELATAAAHAVDGRPIIIGAPAWIMKTAGSTSGIIGRWREAPPIFTSGKAREALHPDWSVSTAELGLTALHPYTPIGEGFAGVVTWYRAHGWLS